MTRAAREGVSLGSTPMESKKRSQRYALLVGLAVVAWLPRAGSALAAGDPPEIRSNGVNRVPACVTPEKLDAFIRTRNPSPEAKFSGIGALYKRHGDAWRVRWDYAFFQMVIETNYLMFRRGDGSPGDVSSRQNNFAGIGATGGGVPGDSYRDVSTGVLAQIQHLVAYSGEHLAAPVAPRTQLKQDDIIAVSLKLGRPVTFADLRNRWAADRNYARSIEAVADRFREQFCVGAEAVARPPAPSPALARGPQGAPPAEVRVPPPQPAIRPERKPVTTAAMTTPQPTRPTGQCRVLSASYGGSKTVLIRAETSSETLFTALTVVEGFERSMVENYVNSRAPGGRSIGEFPTSQLAMDRARQLCPGAT